MSIKNIAVIAHVDHGKTTLIDELLKQSGTFNVHQKVEQRVMDSNDLEKERGITILSKNCAIDYKESKINIIDTPGHADFGGEVERVLKMVDSVLLLVDSYEGVMPQTKFVVKKALEIGLKPIVVINKIDKPNQRASDVVDEIFDLFVAFNASDEQLDFKIVYTSAKNGFAKYEIDDESNDFLPLFETIMANVPDANTGDNKPFCAQVFSLAYDNFIGKISVARVFGGQISANSTVALCKGDGTIKKSKITKLFGFKGLEKQEIKEAQSGDIIALGGFEDADVGDSFCDENDQNPMPLIKIEEPTISVTFSVNSSPFAGMEGKNVTSNKIEKRLDDEMKTNIAMRYKKLNEGSFRVDGRGELQITILAENMRREDFEFSIARPEVIIKEIDGVKMEPYELLTIDVPDEFSGSVIEKFGNRGGNMTNMQNISGGYTRVEFEIPARSLIGIRSQFLTDTKGEGILNSSFLEFRKMSDTTASRKHGALISMENGEALGYSIFNLQDRGVMFIKPSQKVYIGMIIGEHAKSNDLDVNPIKGKNLTNVRASGSDEALKLVPPRALSLESALEWINSDELVEVTPQSIRVRKKELNPSLRKKQTK